MIYKVVLISGIQQSDSVIYICVCVCNECVCVCVDYIHIYIYMEKEMATHSRILAWRMPWTEEPGRLQSM